VHDGHLRPGRRLQNTPARQGDCDDEDVCTTDRCDPQDGCVHEDNSGKCDDGDECTDDSCDPDEGCVHTQNDSCNLICRTPGFWGTHADEDPGKPCSQEHHRGGHRAGGRLAQRLRRVHQQHQHG
jgi:hypothetical protein